MFPPPKNSQQVIKIDFEYRGYVDSLQNTLILDKIIRFTVWFKQARLHFDKASLTSVS